MKKTGGLKFVAGFVLGAVIFGGTAALAVSVLAQPKTAGVVIDGRAVDLKGSVIEDTHYFQLRDLDAALKAGGKDFSIVWDSANNQIVIDTTRGYDPNDTLPAPTPPPSQTSDNAMTIDEMKAEIVRLTNDERVKAGLPTLEILPELMDCAQTKAQDMLDSRYFGHNSPTYGSANDMVKALVPGYKGACENINFGGITPAEVISGWVISEEHYKNLVDPRITHIGVGIVENSAGALIWVQQLMRK